MFKNIKDRRVSQRVMSVTLDWEDLKGVILDKAKTAFPPSPPIQQPAGFGMPTPTPEIKIVIRQLTEGSPSYNISKWEADVTITESL